MTQDEPFYCPAQTYPQTLETPAEFCENEVEDEGDHCPAHGGWNGDEPDYSEPDDWRERQAEDRFERDYWDD